MESPNPSANMVGENVPEVQPYTHHALSDGEFRLLSLEPGTFDSPISISLEHRILSESSNTYEALSYAWGTSPERKTIRCGDGTLGITVNLFDALRRLRSITTTRVLWIDAICINQEGLDERSSQVPLMRYIFPGASQVIVWVGEEDDMSRLAISTLEEWSSLFTEDMLSKPHIRQEFQSRFGLRIESNVKAISSFLRRPWFSRSWTLQEISLCQDATILCGEVEMLWISLYKAYLVAVQANLDPLLMDDNPQIFPRCSQVMITNWGMRKGGVPPDSLPGILSVSYQFEASDPRDKIYSVLSLADINDFSLYVPRYDMLVCDTYTLFTLATIKDTNNLSMLTTICRESPDPELPSWVSDWREPPITAKIHRSHGIYNVNHNILPFLNKLQITLSPEIQLDGACVNQVSRTYSLAGLWKDLRVGEGRWDFTMSLSSFSKHINLGSDYSITGEDMLMAMFRTLNVDRGFLSNRQDLNFMPITFPWHHLGVPKFVLDRTNKRNMTKWYLISKIVKRLASAVPQHIRQAKDAASYNVAIRKVYKKLPLNSTRLAVNTSLSTLLRYLPLGKSYHKDATTLRNISNEAARHITAYIDNRSFFVTKRGYIGIGPNTMKSGDIVCTLFGSTVPFILRAVEGSEKFRLLGESYVHGIMDGELWKETDDGKIEPAAEGLELRNFTLI
jgi:hypothetical protein